MRDFTIVRTDRFERFRRQLRAVEAVYDLMRVEARRRGDPQTPSERRHRWVRLRRHFVDRHPASRRAFRRQRLEMPALIKLPGRFGRAVVRDISPGGALVYSSLELKVGQLLLIKIGQGGTDQYSFPARVCRVSRGPDGLHLGLQFNGAPLRVRYGENAATS